MDSTSTLNLFRKNLSTKKNFKWLISGYMNREICWVFVSILKKVPSMWTFSCRPNWGSICSKKWQNAGKWQIALLWHSNFSNFSSHMTPEVHPIVINIVFSSVAVAVSSIQELILTIRRHYTLFQPLFQFLQHFAKPFPFPLYKQTFSLFQFHPQSTN